MTTTEQRTRVLAIGGWGRCGSTLLDMMLGQLEGFVSAGEVREVWLRGCAENRPCGCGAPFDSCEFWSQVGKEAFGGWDKLDLDTVLRVRYRRDRAWSLPGLLAGSATSALDAELRGYVEALERLLGAIASVAGAEVVVDSSKLPSHTLLLERAGALDVRLVHLVRDSRGVAYSNRKHVVKTVSSGEPTMLPRYRATTSALRFDLYNGVHHLLARRRNQELLRVRYEDVVVDPQRWLHTVAHHAGVVVPEDLPFLEAGKVHLMPNHLVDGNPVRFAQGAVPLTLDTAWQAGLTSTERRTTTALTLPLLLSYGYRLTPAKPEASKARTAEGAAG